MWSFIMTKKDYILLAKEIQAAKQMIRTMPVDEKMKDCMIAGVFQTQLNISNALKTDNFQFDSKRFNDACRE